MAENEKEIELSKLAQHVAMATLSHPFTQERFFNSRKHTLTHSSFNFENGKGPGVNAIRI